MTTEKINELMNALNSASGAAIEHYTNWYFIQAIVLILFGFFLCLSCIVLAKHAHRMWKADKKRLGNFFSDQTTLFICLAIATGTVGILFIVFNIATLIEPTAYAIHELIEDIRG